MSSKPLQTKEWLGQSWAGDLPFDFGCPIPTEGAPPTILQVLTCLIYKNGGSLNPGGYGITENGGIYGSFGLSQREAFCLIQMGSFYRGLLAAHGEDHDMQPFDAELDRVAALRPSPPTDGG